MLHDINCWTYQTRLVCLCIFKVKKMKTRWPLRPMLTIEISRIYQRQLFCVGARHNKETRALRSDIGKVVRDQNTFLRFIRLLVLEYRAVLMGDSEIHTIDTFNRSPLGQKEQRISLLKELSEVNLFPSRCTLIRLEVFWRHKTIWNIHNLHK